MESSAQTEAKHAAFLSLSPEIDDFITWNEIVRGYKIMEIWMNSKRMEHSRRVRDAARL